MSNRLPLLKIIKEHFVDCEDNFQIFMTTYDKIWFELVKSYFGNEDWEYIEMYPKKLKDEDFEIPIILKNDDFITKAEQHLDARDYKAAAVYIRTEFERLVKVISEKLYLRVVYKTKSKEYKSDDFWKIINRDTNVPDALKRKIETHRGTVMNPFSHYDLEKPEFRRELEATIEAVKELRDLHRSKQIKKQTEADKLKKEVKQLQKSLANRKKVIENLKKRK